MKLWWAAAFDFHFSLPYFVICRADQRDNRTVSDGNNPFRSSHSLSFLDLNSEEEEEDGLRLYEVVVSLCVTGLSEKYWTCICLKDEFHEFEPRLEFEDDLEEVEGDGDPITFEESSRPTSSPRTYYFQTFHKFFINIVDHKKNFAESFRNSIPVLNSAQRSPIENARLYRWLKVAPGVLTLVRRRVTELKDELHAFLKHAAIGPDGLPKSPLLQSLREDTLAMRSLKSLLKSYNDLDSIEKKLGGYESTCAELERMVRRTSHWCYRWWHSFLQAFTNGTGTLAST